MAELDPLAIVILVLLGVIAAEGLVLGAWVWYRGTLLLRAEYRECVLKQAVGRLERDAERRVTKDRLEGMTNAEAIADFDHHAIAVDDPDANFDHRAVIFDDTGES